MRLETGPLNGIYAFISLFFLGVFFKIKPASDNDVCFLSILSGRTLSVNVSTNLSKRISRLDQIKKQHGQKLNKLQSTRLWLGLLCFVLLVFSQITKGWSLELIALFVFLPSFIFFFRKSRKQASFIKKLQDLEAFYQEQLDFQLGRLKQDKEAEDMIDVNLARDLDLAILFSHLNYCLSKQGEETLNHWLCQDFRDSSLQERHDNIRILAKHPGLVRRLQIQKRDHLSDFDRIQREVDRSFFPVKKLWHWLIPVAWLTLLIFVVMGVPAILWKLSLLIYMGLMLSFLGQTQHIFSRLQDLYQDFASLGDKIETLEKIAQRVTMAPSLAQKQASKDVKNLKTLISLMSIKTNPIVFYLLNLILPWDFVVSQIAEKSREKFYGHFQSWSHEVAKIEAMACLANLKIYHNTSWAEENESFIKVEALAHPLLSQNEVVTNDFDPQQQRIILITGSNMSGKSTFLRALGLNFCLANIGASVFARRLTFKTMPIATCIRVSDSLRDGQSYFYAEVQRMKSILDQAQRTPLFFLIDEPLRGTNNRERLIGNQSYLQQILQTQACGLISTHDLELTQLAEVSDKISNYHFSDQWLSGELKFDYKIKHGPSQSTNALKILEREGLYHQIDS